MICAYRKGGDELPWGMRATEQTARLRSALQPSPPSRELTPLQQEDYT
jgi:hypothetical protein